ncbi:hypothetical protein [Roseomonas marmotae]|uniref:Uncharacterized protein n=1 Tax=Roseomonas marmotae TaxID=2768161 RepID=A0ABS3KHS2_9PROT|nr:hypothetical protein [Roseomonas marmotae]MBO1077023.1 hypothetical protein [Roseomonas marmotae]QTI78421.1 hypothetical protein IAI58_12060 [Roseomonas marmotae]
MSEAVSEAAARLERAVGRLAEALAKPRPQPQAGIPAEQVEALASRLDISLAKLRAALVELDAPEPEPHDPMLEEDEGVPPAPPATAQNEER